MIVPRTSAAEIRKAAPVAFTAVEGFPRLAAPVRKPPLRKPMLPSPSAKRPVQRSTTASPDWSATCAEIGANPRDDEAYEAAAVAALVVERGMADLAAMDAAYTKWRRSLKTERKALVETERLVRTQIEKSQIEARDAVGLLSGDDRWSSQRKERERLKMEERVKRSAAQLEAQTLAWRAQTAEEEECLRAIYFDAPMGQVTSTGKPSSEPLSYLNLPYP
eukprot:TRINITY_DN10775_c0_g1_i1.p1 TRINITY_DN10775_c0_g1~~TRINITY_DN10775_c0_g1_i1.p1  ORF type:complete len:232 (-),score=27.46 TRINITY_DN10775_c0_g1_i1:114-773(-)